MAGSIDEYLKRYLMREGRGARSGPIAVSTRKTARTVVRFGLIRVTDKPGYGAPYAACADSAGVGKVRIFMQVDLPITERVTKVSGSAWPAFGKVPH